MSLTIRQSEKADAGVILGFIRALAEYEKLLHEVEASEADLERDLFGDNPRVFCDIAEFEGKPVGFVLWYYTYSTFRGRYGIWLEDLFVYPEYRGKGFGKALMVHLAQRCVAEDLARFEWSVLDWNQPSIDFYKSIGAEMQEGWSDCRVDGVQLKALAKA
jgi:GNAT superfamily N-acetyltransferase